MKQNLQNLALVLGSVLMTFLVLEGLLVAYLHLSDRAGADLGATIAQREATLERQSDKADQTTRDELDGKIVLHPLFGYTYNPADPSTNNFGFPTRYDFDLEGRDYTVRGVARDRALVVGIFGGSFAGVVGEESDHMERRLQEIFPDRRPVVINFGIGGHALPQSAFIYLYFRDLVDIPVFVDGLNEVWNYPENNQAGVPPEYAKARHFKFKTSRQEITPRTFELTERILGLRGRIATVTRVSLLPIFRWSRIVHYGWRTLVGRWKRQINELSLEIVEGYGSERPFFDVEDERIVEFAVHQWGRYHALVHASARADGKLSLHLLQPNPFVPDSKELTQKEERLIQSGRGFEGWVVRGYPGLSAELGRLTGAEGLVAEDLTGMFRDVEGEIWIDGAHTNPRGSRLVIDRMVTLIERHVDRIKSPNLARSDGTVRPASPSP